MTPQEALKLRDVVCIHLQWGFSKYAVIRYNAHYFVKAEEPVKVDKERFYIKETYDA